VGACSAGSHTEDSWAGVGSLADQRTKEERRCLRVLTFFRDDEGQGLVEYALIIAVIAIAVIVAMIFLRGQLQNIFSNIGNNLT
jgi:pilus assembly protein Flp/PilA